MRVNINLAEKWFATENQSFVTMSIAMGIKMHKFAIQPTDGCSIHLQVVEPMVFTAMKLPWHNNFHATYGHFNSFIHLWIFRSKCEYSRLMSSDVLRTDQPKRIQLYSKNNTHRHVICMTDTMSSVCVAVLATCKRDISQDIENGRPFFFLRSVPWLMKCRIIY